MICIACGVEHGAFETHTAHDCAEKLRVDEANRELLREKRGWGIVPPKPKDWQTWKAA